MVDYLDMKQPFIGPWQLPLTGYPTTSGPTVTLISPTLGSPLQPTTAVVIEVDDPAGIQYMALSCRMGTTWETVWREGEFAWNYSAGSTMTEVISGRTYRFSLVRRSGWREPPTIHVDAVDVVGMQDP